MGVILGLFLQLEEGRKGGSTFIFFSPSHSLVFLKNLLSIYYVLESGDIPVEKTHQGLLHFVGEAANNYTVE